jgi:ParB family chromosome partitioning protein
MTEGRRGLGRGLSALLDEVKTASTAEGRRAAGVLDMDIASIQPNPEQPRRAFATDELDELAASIRERGVLQPILVRPLPGAGSEYQIVAGERRWRAAQRAGLRVIPALVRDLADQEVMEVALIENIQRADLNALEEARGYEAMARKFERSADAIAKVVGKSRSHVANTLRLMKLPPAIQDHLESGRLTAGHARALLDLDDATSLAEQVIKRGLNVRQTEVLARAAKTPARPLRGRNPPREDNADTRALEADLEDLLGLKVEIHDRGGSGELRLAYETLEQLDDLCRRLSHHIGPA